MIFWGKVQKGDGRGKKLGFPTANMSLHKTIDEGVYLAVVMGNGLWDRGYKKELPALTFVGFAKTFGKTKYQAETYILDFSKDIYFEYLTVKLLKKLRGNKKFNGAQDLVEQMKKDEWEARKFFKIHQTT